MWKRRQAETSWAEPACTWENAAKLVLLLWCCAQARLRLRQCSWVAALHQEKTPWAGMLNAKEATPTRGEQANTHTPTHTCVNENKHCIHEHTHFVCPNINTHLCEQNYAPHLCLCPNTNKKEGHILNTGQPHTKWQVLSGSVLDSFVVINSGTVAFLFLFFPFSHFFPHFIPLKNLF